MHPKSFVSNVFMKFIEGGGGRATGGLGVIDNQSNERDRATQEKVVSCDK